VIYSDHEYEPKLYNMLEPIFLIRNIGIPGISK